MQLFRSKIYRPVSHADLKIPLAVVFSTVENILLMCVTGRLLNRYYLPALFSRGGKVCTLGVAAGLVVLGVFGLATLRMGLEPQLAAPADFYLQAKQCFRILCSFPLFIALMYRGG